MSTRDEILETVNVMIDNADNLTPEGVREMGHRLTTDICAAMPDGENENGSHFVIFGGPIEGFEFIGPFADFEKAAEWAEMNAGMSWWIIQPDHPDNN